MISLGRNIIEVEHRGSVTAAIDSIHRVAYGYHVFKGVIIIETRHAVERHGLI